MTRYPCNPARRRLTYLLAALDLSLIAYVVAQAVGLFY